ncbi:MAG TPA: DUF2330 domain-containing protein [Candidatus Eisenbacteria bacterium]|nr:DUF2330 domain-containing protein [Candidatus Eisenbacteria bacterium]
MNRVAWPFLLLPLLLLAVWAPPAASFCGFYVARGDAKIFNKASKVVLVRDDDRTVLTMANDFKGDPKEFAIVVPVPTVLQKGQIHVGDKAPIDHLDAYTAPRLVEYFDPDPCQVAYREEMRVAAPQAGMSKMSRDAARERSLGVRVEARYTVGEYDIVILSAKQSGGLETWLHENGYTIPRGASRVLAGYIKQDMKFFVAKVNLKEQAKLGFSYLRPIQVAFESPKFILPIRLGMVNADGPQELFVFALTKNGRVETTNYRTVRLPSDAEVPTFVKDEFSDFYRAMFTEQVRKERGEAVFLEYAWDMGWCDPCAADPLSAEELRQLGVWWVGSGETPRSGRAPSIMPGGAQPVFVTRLHVRYDRAHFPEDLVLQQTGDRSNFQGRFVIRHPWKGDAECRGAEDYRRQLRERRSREAETLSDLTGWPLDRIRRKMNLASDNSMPDDNLRWWDRIWAN